MLPTDVSPNVGDRFGRLRDENSLFLEKSIENKNLTFTNT